MKLKSLILGSVAAAGLSTGAMAADLNTVLTSLNVCDALGLTGLTLSSTATDDTAATCLQITGNVDYRLRWGDYNGALPQTLAYTSGRGATSIINNDGVAPLNLDWSTRARAWVQFVGTSDTSVGPASATIRMNYKTTTTVKNEVQLVAPLSNTVTTWGVDRAFVSIGSGTVLTAGLRTESIANFGDDKDYLQSINLFNAGSAGGVGYTNGILPTAGQVIQVTSDLGNGVSVSGALENINGTAVNAGTAIGVLDYSGDSVNAHITGLAGGVLDGTVENWAVHAGATVELDMFNLRGAFAADNSGYWNVLGTAEATFDMFTLAVAGEAASGNQLGFGLSGSAAVTDTVTINAAFAWFDSNTTTLNNSNYRALVELVANVTETITLTGTVGADVTELGGGSTTGFFAGKVGWEPGGDYKASAGIEVNSIGAYRVSFDASKAIN